MEDVVEVPSTGISQDNDDVTVDETVGGTLLLAANRGRKSALIINTGGSPMRVTTDGSDPTLTRGKLVPGGGSLSLSPPYCPTAEVKAICEAGVTTTANASEVS